MSTPALMEAVVGNGTVPESGIGFEPVSRATRLLLLEQLNEEIARQHERWNSADSALQNLGMDEGVGQVDPLSVPAANFHEGPHRSLLDAPIEAFPNISVMAFRTLPAASNFIDQAGDSSDITLFIESATISGPVPDGMEVAHESIVHRRIQRMTEAVAVVVGRNKGLLGTAHNLQTPPRGGVGNSSWLRRKDKGAGVRFIWHGSRLQYTLTRHHTAF